jgi:hypothetical protein
MGQTKCFTEEEMHSLSSSCHVKKVTEKSVMFTECFKTEFWKLYQEGYSPKDIMKSHGIDTDALGRARISALTGQLRKKADKGERFLDKREGRKPKSVSESESIETRLKTIEQNLEYLRALIEYERKVGAR